MTARRGWHEALLWLPDRRLLVCAETLGTAGFDLPAGRSAGHAPVRRPSAAAAFAGIDPAVIAVGHGPPLRDGAGAALRRTLRRPGGSYPVTGCGSAWRRSERREPRGKLVADRRKRRPHIRLDRHAVVSSAPTSAAG